MNRFQDIDYVRKLYSEEQQIPFRGEFLKTYSNRNRSIRDILFSFIGGLDSKSVLDIGAGSGSFIKKLQDAYPHATYVALDIAEHPDLKQRKSITYKIYDGEELPLELGRFDVILMMHMLYHVSHVEAFLRQVAEKFVKEKTKIYITTKSKNTMPKIEASFQNVLNAMETSYEFKALERDEAHFSRENAYELIEKSFKDIKHTIKQYDFDTQLLVDNQEDLLNYILSTPRYGDNKLLNDDPEYLTQWKAELAKDELFIDKYSESLYVIEF
jgi:2-polyprenyl-3-methyl-5-hydroxy-6-metoxy-1,4-benzoquinol methylase